MSETLFEFCDSRVKSALLKFLVKRKNEKFYERELARLTHFSATAVSNVLSELMKQKIVKVEAVAYTKLYFLDNKKYSEILCNTIVWSE